MLSGDIVLIVFCRLVIECLIPATRSFAFQVAYQLESAAHTRHVGGAFSPDQYLVDDLFKIQLQNLQTFVPSR